MWIKFLLLLFVFSFLFRTDTSFDQDLGRHLKLGEIITQTSQVPKVNLFSYTNEGFSFVNTHWLFEVFVYIWSITLGVELLLVLKVIIFLLSVWIILKIIPNKNQVLLLPMGFIFLHVLRERLELRPEIFSFLFTASSYYILEKYLKGPPRLIFLLPLIQLIWINTHIYFFVGLILQAIFLIHLSVQKLRVHPKGVNIKLPIIIFILSAIFSLINPNGLAGVLYPLNVTKNYGYTIVENQTMFLLEKIQFRDPNFWFVKFSAGIIILSLIIALLKRQFEVKNILLSVSGLVLALMHVRSFPYLVFLSLPATLQNFGTIPWNGLTQKLAVGTVVILILESFFYLNGDYYRARDNQYQVGLKLVESGREALNFVLLKDLPAPIFNNFDIGSYILYRGYPKYQVFIDGRPEAYPAQFFSGVYIPSQSDYKNFKEIEKIYQFKTIIFSHTDQTPWGRNFLQNVVKDESWKPVYIDDFMLVLVRSDVLDNKQLAIINLATLDPNSFRFDGHAPYLRLGLFLLSTGYTNSGRQFITKTLQIFPDSPIANQIVGNSQKSQSKFFW